jgi:hypothetical protein
MRPGIAVISFLTALVSPERAAVMSSASFGSTGCEG